MKLAVKFVLSVFALLSLVAFPALVSASHAAGYPDSPCSAPAVGLTESGDLWPADGVPKAAPRMQVNGGVWRICQPWVKDGELPRRADAPQPRDCRGLDSVSWAIDGRACSASLPPARHGFSALATQEMGAMRGQATYTCTDGRFSLDAQRSRCDDAPACDALQTIRFGSGENCSVTIDSRGRARKPVGTVLTLPADGRNGFGGPVTLRCEFGGWQLAGDQCIQR